MVLWIEPQSRPVPQALREALDTGGAYDDLVAELLVQRGITDPQVACGFLDPACYEPQPASALPGLDRVVDRLQQAIARRERMAVWGDFDVDGQTATALYVQALQTLGAEVEFTIPSRRESHGVHPVGVQRLIDRGIQLILTADTGVDAHPAIDLARRQEVDVLVTDHHDIPTDLPRANAIVNPKRLPAEHPLYELPGVGVAYQVARALYESAGYDAGSLLDLVALGIVADVATLHGDVRYLLQLGLRVLRRAERVGLQALFELAQRTPSLVSEEDIGFALAPRLNALSRVGDTLDARIGVELLTTDDLTRARTIAQELEALNAQRKWLTQQTTDAALAQLERDRSLLDGPAIVVAGRTWDPGIVGIVAGRLSERYHRPAIVISAPDGEMARGSARSVEGIDVHAAIAAQRHMLYRCGGHPMAAGLSLEGDRIPAFRQALWRSMTQAGVVAAEKKIQLDATLSLDQLSLDLVEAVDRLSPFGAGNSRPVFVTHRLELARSAVIGRTREHRRLVVRDAEEREQTVLWWQSANQPLPDGQFDLAYTLGINTFRGERNVQLTWVDFQGQAARPIEVAPRPTIEVVDRRALVGPAAQASLRGVLEAYEDAVVWAEVSVPSENAVRRLDLRSAETLVIWTVPPGPFELRDALEAVSPRRVILFGTDPGVEAFETFLERLGGLVKYALRAKGGQVLLSELAGHMAHSVPTVRLGLQWMALKGRISMHYQTRDRIVLRLGDGQVSERLPVVQGQLQARLAETAAYRGYFLRADAERLIAGVTS